MKLSEMTLPEEKVLEKLNLVSTAKRTATMVRAPANLLYLPPTNHMRYSSWACRQCKSRILENGKKFIESKGQSEKGSVSLC